MKISTRERNYRDPVSGLAYQELESCPCVLTSEKLNGPKINNSS